MAGELLLSISRALSYSVILISTCMKMPQIWRIYSAGSSKGISVRGYWLEVASYSAGASYGYFHNIHFSNYLELIILAMQSGIIITLSISYLRRWDLENGLCFVLLSSFLGLSFTRAIPGSVLDTLILLSIPLSASSKLLQINALHRAQSGGDVSLLTWALATYGCGVRVFTTIVEVASMSVLTSYSVSFILNMTIVAQISYYGQTKHKKQ